MRHSTFVAGLIGVAWVGAAMSTPTQNSKAGQVAVVYPMQFDKSGTDGSHEMATKAIREVLQKSGQTLIADKTAEETWSSLRLPLPTDKTTNTLDELTRFGKAVGARYVVTGSFHYHSRPIWVNTGPKTISTVTTEIKILDVQTGQLAYTDSAEGRSDERENALKDVAAYLISPLIVVVSGGPKTPQEQRATQIAVARALHHWVKPITKSK